MFLGSAMTANNILFTRSLSPILLDLCCLCYRKMCFICKVCAGADIRYFEFNFLETFDIVYYDIVMYHHLEKLFISPYFSIFDNFAYRLTFFSIR